MTRYKLTLEYNGMNLIGWQENAQGPSVQSLLQDAIFKFCQQWVEVIAAGRTDSGVHALGMVAHFDLSEQHAPETVMRAVNFYLIDSPVVVLSCEIVSEDFHARFSCTRRNYRYIILNRPAPVVLDKNMVWWIPRPLDVERMRTAADKLMGSHDWTSFRASECQAKSPIKTMDKVEILGVACHPSWGGLSAERTGGGYGELCEPPLGPLSLRYSAATPPQEGWHATPRYIIIDFSARSFLHHQVRNMVGTLVEIGLGKPFDIDEIFAAKNRSAAGPTAPAHGLYFVSAEY